MSNPFKNIMVIVDGAKGQELLLEKAIELAEKFDANLHFTKFLNRMQYIMSSPVDYHLAPVVFLNSEKRQLEHSLNELKNAWVRRVNREIYVKVLNHLPENELANYVKQEEIDLIVLMGCRNKLSWNYFRNARIEKIIRTVNCPVLTITSGSALRNIRAIVMPVGPFIPGRKVKLAYLFAKNFAARIHLVSGGNSDNDVEKNRRFDSLLSTMNLLNSWGGVQVECRIFDRSDTIEAALNYAKKIPADLLVVNSGNESRLSGLFNSLLGARLYTDTQIPVLTVKPYP